MEDQLDELLQFLHDRNPNVRQIALSNLLGHTPKGSQYRHLFSKGTKLTSNGCTDAPAIRDLKLLCRDQLAIAHDAFCALVNLSDIPLLSQSLSEDSFLKFVVSYIIDPGSKLVDLAAMLLSNITKPGPVAARVVNLTVPIFFTPRLYPPLSRSGTSSIPDPLPAGDPHEVKALPLLVDAFVEGASTKDGNAEYTANAPRQGSLNFLASLFANVTVIPEGRTFFLTPSRSSPTSHLEYPLVKLVLFTEHMDTIRRGGVSSTIKNCAFHVPGHQALLSPEDSLVAVPPNTIEAPGIDILQYILLPLAGPEELDLEEQENLPLSLQFLPNTKVREKDAVLRSTHVETLLLLCTTRWGRDFLRNHGTYEIIRVCHENETEENISEHIERLVNLLKRDEATATEEIEVIEGSPTESREDEIIEEV